ncbi:aldose epimerase family protein [Lentilactobacillus sunkii]|uniref:Maltose epimerase n=1 Tax=Lentilactobacillus sunkii DSM 19904 TaxID=1423808 RepID=A0A0R1LCY2_9LACO|nr:aldose epimerase family protein [Lentilactobacillus sunkii]KRK89591.1 aldose 1-epimerase [Lentilactobacillus sunkii DSM 19904]
MDNKVTGKIDQFDDYQGHPIKKLTLKNSNNVSISVITLGSTLYELNVPDENGQPHNIVLNYQHSEDYLKNPFYVCMGIGRVAGRIADGKLVIDQNKYNLPTNEGSTTLHGGPHGFNTQIWDGKIETQNGQDVIVLQHLQRSEDDGFPGDMDVTITYSLSDDDVVSIKFTAKSTEDTVFNPTQHTYFNLGDGNTINDQLLKINSSQALKLDDKKIPTKERIDVNNTPYDFNGFKKLGESIAAMGKTKEKGFDDVFPVNPDTNNIIAELRDPATNRGVTVESSRDGMILFTANSFTHENMNFVRTNGVGNPYLGVALEPMFLAKPGQDRDFSEMKVPKNHPVTHTIKYHLSY